MADPPPKIRLITGPDELLVARKAEEMLAAERQAQGELEVTDVRARELGEEGLPDIRTPSLFGAPKAVVIRDAHQLPATHADELRAALDGPVEALVLLLAEPSERIKRLAAAIKAWGGRTDVAPPRDFEDAEWRALIKKEVERHGRTADAEAIDALFQRAGTEPSAIAEKVAQVAAGAPAGRLNAAQVRELTEGQGNRGAFAVVDAVANRNPEEALRLLRGALAAGEEAFGILGALAHRLRAIVAVAAGIDPKAIDLRISPGQAGFLKGKRRNFAPGELTRAMRILADADAEMKGGDLPPELVLERAVLAIADPGGERTPRRVVPDVARTG